MRRGGRCRGWSEGLFRVKAGRGSAHALGAILLRGHQPIADARLVEDQTRLIGVGFDFLTQLSDQHPKILQREALIVRPDPLQQEVVGHDEPEMGRQNMEQVVFVLGQRDLDVVEFDPAADKIDLEGACKDDRVPGTLKCRRIAASLRAINSGMLNGLTTKSSAPACKSRTVSSCSTPQRG